jgi:hypothetical protein
LIFDELQITRQSAARQQIDTAIELFLANQDPVSINVLTWAAVEMLRGVATARGVETFNAMLEDRIKPEYLKEWRSVLKGHYNFFRHSDRDPERIITDFRPEATTWALFGACHDYVRIYGTRSLAMLVFQQWFLCRHPKLAMPPLTEILPALSANGIPTKYGRVSAQIGMAKSSIRRRAESVAIMPSWRYDAIMTAPQLSVRSARARDLAHKLSQQERRPIHAIVEDALVEYAKRHPVEGAASFLRRMRATGESDDAAVAEIEAAIEAHRKPHRGIEL